MLVTTTIDLPPELYRFFIAETKDMPHTTPEKYMVSVLQGYMNSQQAHIAKANRRRSLAKLEKTP